MLGRRKMTTFKEQGARKKTRGKGGEKRLEESEGEKEETKKWNRVLHFGFYVMKWSQLCCLAESANDAGSLIFLEFRYDRAYLSTVSTD